MNNSHDHFMRLAIALSIAGMRAGDGGPFGAIIVRNGELIARGNNQVILTNDPTAHAEVVAIRAACQKLGSFQLTGCILYTSCEPCPMCLGAIYWARPDQIFFANSKSDAAAIGFDDQFIYDELDAAYDHRKIAMRQILRDEALEAFAEWSNKSDRIEY
jgi:guanine deaminase